VGKSRLLRAATDRAEATRMTVLSGRAAPGAAVAFRPLTGALLSASRDGRLATRPTARTTANRPPGRSSPWLLPRTGLFAASQADIVNNLNEGLAWGLFPSIKRDRQVTAKLNIRDWRENSVISEPTRLILLPGEVASGRGYGVLSFQRTVSGADER